MKQLLSLFITLLVCLTCFAQKQSYDVLQYSLPEGWQQKDLEGCRQLVVSEHTTSEFAIALLVKSGASNGSANEHFREYWNRLLKTSITVSEEPIMQESVMRMDGR